MRELKPMGQPTIQVLGVHPVELTQELLQIAYDLKYGPLGLSATERRNAEQQIREEIGRAVLIELVVEGRDDRFDVSHFGCFGSF